MADIDYTNIKNFDDLVKNFQKDYSKELIRLGNDNEIKGVEWWDLDSPNIVDLFGGGIPKGRIIEVIGEESSGKTSLCYYISGQVQKQGGKVLYIDFENAVDKDYAEQMGLQLDKALIVQPDYGEQGLDIAQKAIESNQVDLVVIDSISACTPKAEIEGDMESQQMGLQARINSKFLRKVVKMCKTTNTSIIACNQYRMRIGIMWGDPRTGTGGKAYKFYASIRVETKRNEVLLKDKTPYGIKCRLKTLKNKVGCPYRDTEVTLLFGKGYDVESEWISFAVKESIIVKTGGWYNLPQLETKIQGLDKVIEYLKENPAYYEKEIKEKVKKIFDAKKNKSVDDKKVREVKKEVKE